MVLWLRLVLGLGRVRKIFCFDRDDWSTLLLTKLGKVEEIDFEFLLNLIAPTYLWL